MNANQADCEVAGCVAAWMSACTDADIDSLSSLGNQFGDLSEADQRRMREAWARLESKLWRKANRFSHT